MEMGAIFCVASCMLCRLYVLSDENLGFSFQNVMLLAATHKSAYRTAKF